jgi:hypothetical protein
MNAIFVILGVVAAALFWLVPLYFVCQWAKKKRKDHLLVGWAGLLTGWLVALVLTLCLPVLSDSQIAEREKRSDKEPMGEAALLFWGLGVMTLMLGGFVLFVHLL